MTFDEISELAKTNACPPRNIIPLYTYELLKILYDDYRQGKITLDEAKKRKQALQDNYKYTVDWAEAIRLTDTLRCEINKAEYGEKLEIALKAIKLITGDVCLK